MLFNHVFDEGLDVCTGEYAEEMYANLFSKAHYGKVFPRNAPLSMQSQYHSHLVEGLRMPTNI